MPAAAATRTFPSSTSSSLSSKRHCYHQLPSSLYLLSPDTSYRHPAASLRHHCWNDPRPTVIDDSDDTAGVSPSRPSSTPEVTSYSSNNVLGDPYHVPPPPSSLHQHLHHNIREMSPQRSTSDTTFCLHRRHEQQQQQQQLTTSSEATTTTTTPVAVVNAADLKELERFAASFKARRIRLGFTQTNVGRLLLFFH